MKRFIKKHIGFVITIGISAIIVLVLLVFVLMQNTKMREAADKLKNQKNAIERLNSAKPSPAKENVESLTADTEKYLAKLDSLHRLFGRPYERALDKFCESLNISTMDFRNMFRTYWEDGIGKNQRGEQIYALFVESNGIAPGAEPEMVENENGEMVEVPVKPLWNKEQWNAAMNAFVEEAQKYTLEEIGDSESASAKELLMASLGVPRAFGGNEARCKAYISAVKANLIKRFAEGGVGLSNDAQKSFGFTVGAMDPSKDQLIPLGKVWDIIADLGGRVASSDVDSLESFSVDSLEGTEGDGGFRLYRFQIEVSGTQAQIRQLTEVLADAYKDSRVYIVRRMSLMKNFDAAQILVYEHLNRNTAGTITAVPGTAMMGGGAMRGQTSGRPSALTSRSGNIENVNMATSFNEGKTFVDDMLSISEEEEKMLPSLRKNYGRPVIGVGQRCTASILVDYAVYVTDELETR